MSMSETQQLRKENAQQYKRIAELEAENEKAWGERDHYLSELMERNTQLRTVEAERDALGDRRLPCREAEVAQRRYEDAEAGRDRFSAILDRGLTIMNDKQDIVGTLALRDAAIAYDADLRARDGGDR